jgi:hypothetical protein
MKSQMALLGCVAAMGVLPAGCGGKAVGLEGSGSGSGMASGSSTGSGSSGAAGSGSTSGSGSTTGSTSGTGGGQACSFNGPSSTFNNCVFAP